MGSANYSFSFHPEGEVQLTGVRGEPPVRLRRVVEEWVEENALYFFDIHTKNGYPEHLRRSI